MDIASTGHHARLDSALKELEGRVKGQELVLERLRESAQTAGAFQEPSANPGALLQQLRMLTATYGTLIPQESYLPPPDSPLPSLLALRTIHQTILETKTSIAQAEAEIVIADERLSKEKADLDNANLITRSLEGRIEILSGEIRERTRKSPSQAAKDFIRELKKKKANYDMETGKLIKAFNKFIDNHLGVMLAAEELGGPVVGEMLDIDELSLEAGFNVQGRPKKPKITANEDKRQRRINEIWGERPPDQRKARESWDEKHGAGAEMRELTEQLLNNLVEAGEGRGDAYVELERESAAARFLVRTKVAQFHPKDARRLRLINFGRDLDA